MAVSFQSPGGAFTRLDRYLMGELAALILFGITLFTIVWMAPEILFRLIQEWVGGHLPFWGVLKLLGLHLPDIFEQSFPMAAMIAGVFISRQLSQQFEWIACYTAKISPWRVALPIVLMGAMMSSLHGLVQETISPWTQPTLIKTYERFGLEEAKRQNFVFLERNPIDPTRLEKFLLIGDIRNGQLLDFFVLYYRPYITGQPNGASAKGSPIQHIFRSKQGNWEPATQSWRLQDGVEYELDSQGVYKSIHPFDQQWVATSPHPMAMIEFQQGDPLSFPMGKLQRFINLLKASHQTQELPYYLVRWHQKWSIPLASLLLLPLGVLLGQEPPRARRTWGLTSAAVVLFVYLASMPFATNFGSLGLFAPWLAAWLPMILALSVGLGLYKTRQWLGL
jgi:lipopolysaccharide export system permease protein